MAAPEVPIEVDSKTGVWTTDGLPMLYVPRHFFLNNHLAVEQALGRESYARLLYEAGFQSAYTWCEKEAATHGLEREAVFHHYMKRLSQRGWARFTTVDINPGQGTAEVRVEHSCFVYHFGTEAGRKVCYMFAGWFPGALAWVGEQRRAKIETNCSEIQCAAERGAEYCLFRVAPAE